MIIVVIEESGSRLVLVRVFLVIGILFVFWYLVSFMFNFEKFSDILEKRRIIW